MQSRFILKHVGCLAAALLFSAAASAQDLKIMAPANPGGGYDQTARGLGNALQTSGQAKSVQYENKGGAGGTIGLTQFVNTDKGNAHAMIVVGAIMIGAIESNKPPITLKDATPLARLAAEFDVLVVPTSSPIKTIADLIKQLKENPGSVSWGGGSKGGIDHILAALIAADQGVNVAKLNYIPFAGGGEASAAILGGQVTVGVSGLAEFQQFIKSGKMRALAVSAGKRIDGVNIPTLKEQGINVEIFNWRGVYGAPGITEAQRQDLINRIAIATKSKSWQELTDKNEWTQMYQAGDEFARFVDSEHKRLGGILRALGMAK